MQHSKDSFLKLPKADVHNHFHIGGSHRELLEKYPETNISFPHIFNGLARMTDFIYGYLNLIMVTKKDVINFIEIAIESRIDDNITLLEASVDIGLTRFFDDSITNLITEVKSIKEKLTLDQILELTKICL